MSTQEERYPTNPTSGPKHSTIEITDEELQHLNKVVSTFMHAMDYMRDAVLNNLKMLPHMPSHQRIAHIEISYAILISEGLRAERDVLDDRFIAGLRITANYLNVDPDQFEALARRGLVANLN